ncbi:tetratricopeptide repeat-containing sulfotransferase family protein [Paraurantiacibacter namhicola]|uniref:Photosystem I assembly protein Ycf3 n=1 Tax=Paraurantiacibacter namhicola TaxID=645517 RepID=A0A1C7D512_9SPHN|nr:tetratricopeptide repeat-containing sulfotransferase family protein [Paraurantiacibacter namhicola]ANU06442.1 photosystem I assembly protein Ycf3 [Paraurantiacibacter namhicola]
MADNATSDQDKLADVQALMYEGKFEDAIGVLSGLSAPDNPDIEALYLTAVCRRYLGQLDESLDQITQLQQVAPDFGRALQEEGHIRRAMGQADRALEAYRRACQSNPALQASWSAQAAILSAQGNGEAAAAAQAQADRLAALPKPLVAVTHLMHEGKILKAESLCREFLIANKTHVEGMRLLADIGVRLGVMDDAEFLLESALEFEPANVQVRIDYIQVLRKRQKFEAALQQARKLFESDPGSPIFQSLYAIEAMQTGDYDQAFELFDKVLERFPDDPSTLTSRGHALKTVGKHEDAIASYRKAFAVNPGFGDAYYGLANLKTYRFSEAELQQMHQQLESKALTYQNQVHVCFALGKAHEDRSEYEKAFRFYEQGNELKRKQSRYKDDVMTAEFDAQIEHCGRDLFAKHEGSGFAAGDPIFVVGLPRAGSTLIEQILASHSQIDGTLELPNILTLSHQLRGRKLAGGTSDYPKVLHDLTGEQLAAMGKDYIDSTAIHRQGAAYFVDKMPNNFRHIGLIQLILPNAKIIDARREPMACCFSGFKQLFAEGQEFTYGLHEIGSYYRDYVRLMDHWDEVLPGRILRVQHEDVLDDLEGQVARILDYVGVPFEQSCVEFHKTKRAVRTASSEQVRQPISKAAVDQWRNFEPWLGPLKNALGPVLERYPIAASD